MTQKQHQDKIRKWLRLHLTDGIGPKTFAKLLQYFGNIDNILTAGPGQLASVPGIGAKKATRLAASRDTVDVDAEIKLAHEMGIKISTLDDPDYPGVLRRIDNPPHILYVKGQITRADSLAIAVVGSRSCSQYGQEQASRLSHLLAASGFTVISGLARGIDTAAHRGALAADGRTIAVQGRGLADVFPPENQDLAEQISKNGAVLSELPMNIEPLANTFPMRNRIISGLALGTLVVEARPRSGALITARFAMEQNREVMAVPGRIDAPGSFGPHQLIKDGAKLVERVEDILEAIGYIGDILKDHALKQTQNAEQKVASSLFATPPLKLDENETGLMNALDHEPIHIDDLIAASGLSAARTNATLTSLQLKGLVKQSPGGYYQKR